MRFFLLISILVSKLAFINAQVVNVPKAFDNIASEPTLIHYKAQSKGVAGGGHLQGTQILRTDSLQYAVVTASSSNYSYYLISGEGWQEEWHHPYNPSIRKIFDNPYRHAGGCQLNADRLCVGVEDNYKRDKSKIVLIDLANGTVKTIIERAGRYERSTAGAVGFTREKAGSYLVAVGDWDSRNIDFYRGDSTLTRFDSIGTFKAEGKDWPAFQSINLVQESSGDFYLLGFSKDAAGNRADLYKVNFNANKIELDLLNTRYFNCKKGAGFRYGAGIDISEGALAIVCCARKLHSTNVLNRFVAK